MKKRIIPALILASSAFALLGCNNEQHPSSSSSSSNSSESSSANNNHIEECFGALSTVKVSQNADHAVYYDKLDPKIDVKMMKNESEAGQIVFKFDKDIASFDVEVADLEDNYGNKISKDDVTVYMQRYLELDKDFDTVSDFPTGTMVPDFLLPVPYAVSSKENTVKKGDYQGFMVDIKANDDTSAGTYTGVIKFTFDGLVKEIPITATVYDFAYEGTREMQSSFLLYRGALVGGEYNASDETVQNYVDMLTDYKVNTLVVEKPDVFDNDRMKEYVANQVRMIKENPNYSSIPLPIVSIDANFKLINIPTSSSASMDNNTRTIWMMYEFIKDLVEVSTDEVNYLDYAYFYLTSFDEMDMYTDEGGPKERGLKFFGKDGTLDQLLDSIIDKLDSLNAFSHFSSANKAIMKKSIKNINRVNPLTTFDEEIVEGLNQTSCPYLSQLENSDYYGRYDYTRDDNANGKLWTYTCVGPKAPYPTFHLGDYNLGSRTTGWTLKRRNVNGYLYYAVNIVDEQNNATDGGFVNPYTSATRNGVCPGDGFLVYPGGKYGSDKPFPSNRLLVFRDGMDDYDLLSVYERALSKASKTYGVDFSYESMMNEVYDTVITNSLYINDDAAVIKAREEVASRITSLLSDDSLLTSSYAEGNKTVTEIYTENKALTIDGTEVNESEFVKAGKGYKYVLKTDINAEKDIEIVSLTSSLAYKISAKGHINDFSSASGILTSENSTLAVNDNALSSTMKSVDKGSDNASKRYTLYVDMPCSDLAGSTSVDFSIKNDSDVAYSLTVSLDGLVSKYSSSRNIYLYPNQEETTYHFNFALDGEEKMNGVTGLRFELPNFDAVNGAIYSYDRCFTVKNLNYYK